jgi:uncharacterized protein
MALALPVWAQTSTGVQPIRLGTSTPGGGFSLYGETLERILNDRAGYKLLTARQTRGTAENLELLKKGELDAALIQGTSADDIFKQGAASGLAILFAMYPSPGLLAVPAASKARKLEDLAGEPVVWGVRASGLVTLARQVFDGIGLDIDRDFKPIYVTQAAESPPLVMSGKAAGLWGAGEGWPGFLKLAESPAGARFLAPAREQIAAIQKKYPLLKPMEVPAKSYPGIEAPLPTMGSVNFILVRADLDDARVAAFVKAMGEAKDKLAAALPQAAFSTLANTLSSAPSKDLLHRALQPR